MIEILLLGNLEYPDCVKQIMDTKELPYSRIGDAVDIVREKAYRGKDVTADNLAEMVKKHEIVRLDQLGGLETYHFHVKGKRKPASVYIGKVDIDKYWSISKMANCEFIQYYKIKEKMMNYIAEKN